MLYSKSPLLIHLFHSKPVIQEFSIFSYKIKYMLLHYTLHYMFFQFLVLPSFGKSKDVQEWSHLHELDYGIDTYYWLHHNSNIFQCFHHNINLVSKIIIRTRFCHCLYI